MIHTRLEKSEAMTRLTYALRETIAASVTGKDELNLAEAMNVLAQTMASVLVGAYGNKNREIILAALPDIVRNYFSEWERIYAEAGHPTDKSPPVGARSEAH